MTSERQILANRSNALQSTGPKTSEGRAISRRNALKHGLTARSLIIDGEHAPQFEELRVELIRTYAPRGIVEDQLVQMLAGLLWRLRRVPALEAAALAWMQRCHQLHPSDVANPGGGGTGRQTAKLKREKLGRAVFHLVRDGDVIDKLNRYETHLILHLGRVAAELERNAGPRKDIKELSAPAAE